MAVQVVKSREDTRTRAEPSPGQVTPWLRMGAVRQLLALMGGTDLIEISIERPEDGLRLVLRRTTEVLDLPQAAPMIGAANAGPVEPLAAVTQAQPEAEEFAVTAPLVGLWFPSLKAGQSPLVAVGDLVREGQVVGAIETLHVMNEVEAPMMGRVRAITVQSNQPVEYGQRLILLDPVADEPGL